MEKEIELLKKMQENCRALGKYKDDLAEEKAQAIQKLLDVLKHIEEYATGHIDSLTETIADYTDDDKVGNADYIGELKERRQHWRDIIRILQDKDNEIYCTWNKIW